MIKLWKGTWIVPLILILISCEEIFFNEELDDNQVTSFDYLWNECNTKYAFFELKQINWQEVYDKYRPMVSNEMSNDSLFNVMARMLNELKDAHVNLVSGFNVSHYDIDLKGPENFNFRLIRENYLGDDFLITGPFFHDFIENGEVGYIYYPSFVNEFNDAQLDYIFKRYANSRGLIIDLRNNGGGIPDNIYKILSRIAPQKTLLYNSYLKNGRGHNNFTRARPAYANPSKSQQFLGKVMVLTNRSTYSASSFFALGARELSNCTLVGDTTGGGLGLPNGGQLPNGWTYRFSVTQTLTPGGENFENGIPPDIIAIQKPEDTEAGYDTVIERALRALL